MIKRLTKLQGGRTNRFVNFPILWMELMNWEKGDVLETTMDHKKGTITIKLIEKGEKLKEGGEE